MLHWSMSKMNLRIKLILINLCKSWIGNSHKKWKPPNIGLYVSHTIPKSTLGSILELKWYEDVKNESIWLLDWHEST